MSTISMKDTKEYALPTLCRIVADRANEKGMVELAAVMTEAGTLATRHTQVHGLWWPDEEQYFETEFQDWLMTVSDHRIFSPPLEGRDRKYEKAREAAVNLMKALIVNRGQGVRFLATLGGEDTKKVKFAYIPKIIRTAVAFAVAILDQN